MNYTIIAIIFLIIFFETCAQYCIKRCFLNKDYKLFCAAVVLYGAVSVLLYNSYRYETMGVVNAIWSAFSVLSVVLVGMIMYHEKVTATDVLGIGLIITGVFCVFVKGHPPETLV